MIPFFVTFPPVACGGNGPLPSSNPMPQSPLRPSRRVGRNHSPGIANDVQHLHVGKNPLGAFDLGDQGGVLQERNQGSPFLRTTPALQHAQQNAPEAAPIHLRKCPVKPSTNSLLRKLERQALNRPARLVPVQRRFGGRVGGP